MARDTQRSRVYAWERKVAQIDQRDLFAPVWSSLDEVRTWIEPIWRSERGRYGKQGMLPPDVQRPARGQRRAYAYPGAHRMTLPRWTRNPWQVLHELTHILVKSTGSPHGPRFVAALIGLAARHLNYDAAELVRLAGEFDLKVDLRSVGAVPARALAWRVEKALREQGPMTPVDLACWLSIGTAHEAVSWKQVHGAMLRPLAAGRVRMLRGRYVLLTRGDEELARRGGASANSLISATSSAVSL